VHRARLIAKPDPRDQVVEALASAFESEHSPISHPLAAGQTELVCCGIVAVLRSRLRQGGFPAAALKDELTQSTLAYCGQTRAPAERPAAIGGRL
jgi:hypothetical protein